MLRRPPDLLITTPESLFLMLTSRARETLTGVRTLILDEVHAVAGTKRGAHLALTVERLERLTAEQFQRIGLSATQRPMEEIGKFVAGGRPIELVDAGRSKELDVEVVVPLEDMREPGVNAEITDLLGTGGESRGQSIWPSIYPRLLELVEAHRSTIVFVNNRRLAERLALRLNELAEKEIARAHHGSLAREQRLEVEELLKRGQIPCLVATSSLELGIDMGAVDLVVQVESPKSVARGLQRIGRAGHDLASVSKGRVFPKFRADLLESAVVVRRMKEGAIEETQIPRNPLDVLAQQIVAIASQEEIEVDELLRLVNRAYPFADLSRVQLENVLDMLAGRYPSDEFAELRPRIVWDRTAGVVRGARRRRPPRRHQRRDDPRPRALRRPPRRRRRPGRRARRGDGLRGPRGPDVHARRLHLADRGDHARPRPRLAGAGRAGRDPVLEGRGPRPAVRAGRGDRQGLARAGVAHGRAGGRAAPLRVLAGRAGGEEPDDVPARAGAGDRGGALRPDDRRRALPRRDRRLARLRPHAVRRAACTRRGRLPPRPACRSRSASTRTSLWSDDGIAFHFPDADAPPPTEQLVLDPDEVDDLIMGELGGTALFGARFRENAARALLIPRRRPGERTPLWQQRLKAQSLLQVAKKYGSFPVMLETFRECLQDVFDLPALKRLLHGVKTRQIDVVDVESASASPYSSSLLFDYIATYMYEDDTPPAERRAQALSLDRDLLRELLGQEELRDLLDPGALDQVESSLAGQAKDPDGLHDLLLRRGDLRPGEFDEAFGAVLEAERRAVRVRVAGEERLIAAEDAGRYRDALGAMPPSGLPGRVPRAHGGAAALAARAVRARPRPVHDQRGG